jgi:hypothetical protein
MAKEISVLGLLSAMAHCNIASVAQVPSEYLGRMAVVHIETMVIFWRTSASGAKTVSGFGVQFAPLAE